MQQMGKLFPSFSPFAMPRSEPTLWSQALHELRNPLSVIQMVLDRFSETASPLAEERRDRYLQRAQQSAALMERLMAQLAQLEYLTDSPGLLCSNQHYVADLIPYVLQQMMTDPVIQAAEEPSPQMINLCSASTCWQGDREMLWHTLQPILQNALQYRPAQGVVEIRWQDQIEPNQLVIVIQDGGEGINQFDLPQLFQPFYRGELGKKSGIGFGLGLAIAQAAALRCNGYITFHYLHPTGSSCRVNLPHPIG
jgi:two-component system, OmpR family, sensor kinase